MEREMQKQLRDRAKKEKDKANKVKLKKRNWKRTGRKSE